MPLVSTIPALSSAHLIGNAVRSAQTQNEDHVEIIGVEDAPIDSTATVAERSAAWNARGWLVRMEKPGNPLHPAMMRHIRSVEPALGRSRFARAIKRRDLVAASFQVFEHPANIGRAGLCAVPCGLIQGKRRKHA